MPRKARIDARWRSFEQTGGWAGDYQKGDECILGDGEFVIQVLAETEEQFQHKYRIKAEGYELDKVINRVAKITQ